MSGDPVDLRPLIDKALPGIGRMTADSLVETARARTVQAGEAIFRQGEPVPMTLILRGHGAFRRTTVDGQLLAVGIGNPGDLFGFSAISATNSPVDFVALTECEVSLWSGPELRRLAASDPVFALDVIDRLAGFVQVMTENVDGFLHQDARRRVIRVLLRHRDLFFAEPAILSRADLPSLVGTSREMTGRVLRELEREGLVARVGRRGLRLLRPDQLELDGYSPRKSADADGRAVGWRPVTGRHSSAGSAERRSRVSG
jgi:CRP-like cAMP-binding protein